MASIAKERTVIVVTHDTSLIQGQCSVFELDKGVLVRTGKADSPSKVRKHPIQTSRLTWSSALKMVKVTVKRQLGKWLAVAAAMSIAAACLAVNFGGMLGSGSDKAFQELLEK